MTTSNVHGFRCAAGEIWRVPSGCGCLARSATLPSASWTRLASDERGLSQISLNYCSLHRECGDGEGENPLHRPWPILALQTRKLKLLKLEAKIVHSIRVSRAIRPLRC
eukprot:2405079-Amphidinium_carterae.1